MKKAPRPEEGYFSRVDAEKRRKIAQQERAQVQREELEHLQKLHHMRCAGCGWELETIAFKGILINKCFNCGGAFLKEDAMEKLCGKDTQFFQSILDMFKF